MNLHNLRHTVTSWNTHVFLLLWIVNVRQYLCSAYHPQLHVPSFVPTDKHSFSDPSGGGKRYYRYLVVGSQNDSIFVGAMEYLYKLNAANINITTGNVYQKSAHLQSDPSVTGDCIKKGKSSNFQCKNHIRIIVHENNRIYVCGTSSYKPRQFYLNSTNLLEESRGTVGDGLAKCPQDPDDQSTAVYVREKNPLGVASLYVGIVILSNQRVPGILRPGLTGPSGQSSPLIRTMLHSSIPWLTDVHFVGSFDMDDYVFFFFREIPEKLSNHDQVVYSRIARVCKADVGGESTLVNRWTTFFKARLNCSISGAFPFYFNEIRDVYKVGDNLFYGVFTSNINGYYGSAVCAFALEEINTVFSGSFSDPKNGNLPVPGAMVPTRSTKLGQCINNSKSLPDNILQFIKNHPLMAAAVSSRDVDPIFHIAGTVLKHIVVYTLSNYVIFYLVSEQGAIYKVVQWKSSGKFHSNLLAVWRPFGDQNVTVWTTKILGDSIYLGTDTEVLQVNRKQCSEYTSCTYCVRDPDCGWDMTAKLCQEFAPGLIRSVEKAGICKQHKICYSGENTVNVMLKGDAVHLSCKTKCTTHQPVRWYHNNTLVKSDYIKWILTQQNGLVVMQVRDTDAGIYECREDDVVLSRHHVKLPECNSIDCIWKEEYREWDRYFREYKEQYKHWACMKNSCDLTQCSNVIQTCGGR